MHRTCRAAPQPARQGTIASMLCLHTPCGAGALLGLAATIGYCAARLGVRHVAELAAVAALVRQHGLVT